MLTSAERIGGARAGGDGQLFGTRGASRYLRRQLIVDLGLGCLQNSAQMRRVASLTSRLGLASHSSESPGSKVHSVPGLDGFGELACPGK